MSLLCTIKTDLGVLGDTCSIAVTKEGIKFSSSGDLGTGSIMLKHNTGKRYIKRIFEISLK